MWREKEQHAVQQLQQGHLEEAEDFYRTLVEQGVISSTTFDKGLMYVSAKDLKSLSSTGFSARAFVTGLKVK